MVLLFLGFFTCGLGWLAIPFAFARPATVCATCKKPVTVQIGGGTTYAGASGPSLASALGSALKGAGEAAAKMTPTQRRWAIAGAGVLVAFSMVVVVLANVEQQAVRARKVEAEQRAAAAEAKAAEEKEAELLAAVPSVVAELGSDLVAFDAALASGDDAAAKAVDARWPERVAAYQGVVVPEIDAVRQQLGCRSDRLAIPEQFDHYKSDVRDSSYENAETAMKEVLTFVSEIRTTCPDFSKVAGLDGFERQAQKNLKFVAPKAEKARKKAREEAEAAERLHKMCGAKPELSGWDGGLLVAERHVQQTANDPDSIDVESCTNPVLTDLCWRVRCKVRGKNAFGAMILNIMNFYIAGGESGNSLDAKVLAAEMAE